VKHIPPSRSTKHVTGKGRRDNTSSELKQGSLAHAILEAAKLVVAVQQGQSLLPQYELLLRSNPGWTDVVRGAIRDLAWTTLRSYGQGDFIVAKLVRKPLPDDIHALLLVALQRLERRPMEAHTIVDQAVDAAATLAPGLKGVVNAVLRNAMRRCKEIERKKAEDLVARYAHPAWWIAHVRAQHPDEWESILAAGNQHPPMALRVNRRRGSVNDYISELETAGMAARRLANDALVLARPVPVSKLPGFAEGRVSVQDGGAQWAAHWLNPGDGERVLDACAAPGGKCAHLLELADIDLTALELDPTRALQIRGNLDRLGLSATILAADCRALDTWWDGRPFDRILADVPCSASGVVRRHPDIKWLRREADIEGFVAQQATIVDALWGTLASGGTMLYVTCSVFDDENQRQIERFLARHPDAERTEPLPDGPRPLLPNDDHDGFYYARLRKKSRGD